jgi:hypothetical protein
MIARDWTDSSGATKTQWTRIGTAFPARQGEGYTITFDALPLPSLNRDGKLECRVMLRPPLPKDGDRAAPARSRGGGGGFSDDLNDDVPFGTNSPHAREPGASKRML